MKNTGCCPYVNAEMEVNIRTLTHHKYSIYFNEGEDKYSQLKTEVTYYDHAPTDIIVMPFKTASHPVKHPQEGP